MSVPQSGNNPTSTPTNQHTHVTGSPVSLTTPPSQHQKESLYALADLELPDLDISREEFFEEIDAQTATRMSNLKFPR